MGDPTPSHEARPGFFERMRRVAMDTWDPDAFDRGYRNSQRKLDDWWERRKRERELRGE